ncbi:unnamed protein product, partial [Adineta steineri]
NYICCRALIGSGYLTNSGTYVDAGCRACTC